MTYAIAPHDAPAGKWMTPGKAYEIYDDDGLGFYVTHKRYCLWTGCAHLNGGNWIKSDHGDFTADPPHIEPEQPTLRDRFAMAALTGLLATSDLDTEDSALLAFKAADAMMEARK